MKNNILKLILVIAIGVLFTGCLEPKTPAYILQHSSDKLLTKNIMNSLKDKKYSIKYLNDFIEIDQYISEEKGHTDPNEFDAIREYLYNYDSSNDEISKVFLQTARERNNTVRTYKNKLNSKIAKRYFSSYDRQYKKLYSDLDIAFIEYDKNNRIKTVLVRGHAFEDTLGTSHDRYSMLIFGREAKRIESTISNYDFANNLLSTISENKTKTVTKEKVSTKVKDLKDFYKLYKDGIISKEEYKKEKEKILSEEKKSSKSTTDEISTQPKLHTKMPTNFSNVLKNTMLQKYNEKYNTNFKSFEEMQKDLINRKTN